MTLLKVAHYLDYFKKEIESEEEGFLKELFVALEWFVSSYWYYATFIPAINIVLTYIVGKYVLTGLLYPYQNSIGRETLDRNNATKFGEEF